MDARNDVARFSNGATPPVKPDAEAEGDAPASWDAAEHLRNPRRLLRLPHSAAYEVLVIRRALHSVREEIAMKPSRREVVFGLVAGALSISTRPLASAAPSDDELIIDTHQHLWDRSDPAGKPDKGADPSAQRFSMRE